MLQNITTFQKHPPSPLPCHIKENCEVKLRIHSPWSVIQVASITWPSSFLPDVLSGSPAVVALYSLVTVFCWEKKNGALGSHMFVHCLQSMLEGSCEAVISHCCWPAGYKVVHFSTFPTRHMCIPGSTLAGLCYL